MRLKDLLHTTAEFIVSSKCNEDMYKDAGRMNLAPAVQQSQQCWGTQATHPCHPWKRLVVKKEEKEGSSKRVMSFYAKTGDWFWWAHFWDDAKLMKRLHRVILEHISPETEWSGPIFHGPWWRRNGLKSDWLISWRHICTSIRESRTGQMRIHTVHNFWHNENRDLSRF